MQSVHPPFAVLSSMNLATAAALVAVLSACLPTTDPPGEGKSEVDIDDAFSYLSVCEAEIGPLPALDCSTGTEVPITATDAMGTQRISHRTSLQDDRCDRPSVDGCTIGTYAAATTTASGAIVAYTCRNYSGGPEFDAIAAIVTLPETGATCFFTTEIAEDRYGDGRAIPRPGSGEDLAFEEGRPFWSMEALQADACGSCHDNDAILRTPWIDAAGVVPRHDPLGPYHIIAREALAAANPDWRPTRPLVHPDAAACTTCHRLGEGYTCDLARQATGLDPHPDATEVYSRWPYSQWMPAFDHGDLLAQYPTQTDWEATFGDAVAAIASCCVDDPPAGCFGEAE